MIQNLKGKIPSPALDALATKSPSSLNPTKQPFAASKAHFVIPSVSFRRVFQFRLYSTLISIFVKYLFTKLYKVQLLPENSVQKVKTRFSLPNRFKLFEWGNCIYTTSNKTIFLNAHVFTIARFE